MLKFIHAADFHLDSAFAALTPGRPPPADGRAGSYRCVWLTTSTRITLI